MAKLTQREAQKLRAEYLEKRESILKGKVNSLQAKLFDKVFNRYLLALEQNNGIIATSERNKNLSAGLERIYKEFQRVDNAPVVESFIKDLGGIYDLNIEYFNTIDKEKTKQNSVAVKAIVNKQLGIKENGEIKKGGFTDKFLRDTSILKKIKQITNKAISNGQSITDFKEALKTYIEGSPTAKDSGGLQQYYKQYAYDTYQKVDRLNQQEFGKKLELKYFIYTGGLVHNSRNFCIHYNGRIIDSEEFSKLTYNDLPESYKAGIPEKDWNPLIDLGGYGCRHSINWVATSFAEANKSFFNKKASERAKKFKANN